MFGFTWGQTRWIAAAVAALATVATADAALAGGRVRAQSKLAATGGDADARGRATFVMKSPDRARFMLKVGRLERNASYDVVADGVKVGEIRTTGGGGGALHLRTDGVRGAGTLGFEPRGAIVVVRDAEGDDVLAGSLSDDSIDPGDVACCIPDDSGAECEDRTEAECLAAGGTVAASATCLPNPCAGAPEPSADLVCCIPDDSGAECEDRTQAECAAQGGTVIDGTSCAPNPCAATPPAQDEIACCVPHGGEPLECETTTPETCAALSGTPTAAASCSANPCADLSPGATPTPSNTPSPDDTPTVSPSPDDTPSPGDTPEPEDSPDDHGGGSGGGGSDD